jgi:mRNA interferase RelE/StbE
VYDLGYHPQVISDLKKLPTEVARRILAQVEKRLTAEPQRSGVRLAGPLRSCWKLRVGDHRVVYTISGETVIVLAILHRRDVYARAERRL